MKLYRYLYGLTGLLVVGLAIRLLADFTKNAEFTWELILARIVYLVAIIAGVFSARYYKNKDNYVDFRIFKKCLKLKMRRKSSSNCHEV
jgi:hypothetical protein